MGHTVSHVGINQFSPQKFAQLIQIIQLNQLIFCLFQSRKPKREPEVKHVKLRSLKRAELVKEVKLSAMTNKRAVAGPESKASTVRFDSSNMAFRRPDDAPEARKMQKTELRRLRAKDRPIRY